MKSFNSYIIALTIPQLGQGPKRYICFRRAGFSLKIELSFQNSSVILVFEFLYFLPEKLILSVCLFIYSMHYAAGENILKNNQQTVFFHHAQKISIEKAKQI